MVSTYMSKLTSVDPATQYCLAPYLFDNVDELWDDIQVEFNGALSDMYDGVKEIYSGVKGTVKTIQSGVSNLTEDIIDRMKK